MFSEIIDISWPVRSRMPYYPGDTSFHIDQHRSIEAGDICNHSSFEMSMHCGTHIDAPLHFIAAGRSVTELDLKIFFGRAKVVQVDAEHLITAGQLAGANLEPGDRLLLKVPQNEQLLDQADFCRDYVALDLEAAKYLAEQRIVLVGMEYLSVESCSGSEREVHQVLLGAGIVLLEGLDLRRVEPGEYFLACAPLKLEGANGSPVRAALLR
jgi:arylformamidase